MTEVKLNNFKGMRTVEDEKQIPEDKSVIVKNIEIREGQDCLRNGFTKYNSTAFSAGIRGIYGYRDRHGILRGVVGGGTTLASLGNYEVTCDSSITRSTNFTLTITKLDVYGVRDYSYNGTADLTENGGGALSIASINFTQGRATTSTIQYVGGSGDEILTITAVDSVDTTLRGSASTSITGDVFTLAYALTGRTSCFLHTRTAVNSSAIFDAGSGDELYFCSSLYDGGYYPEWYQEFDLSVIAINTSGDARLVTVTSVDLKAGLCLAAFGSTLYMGTAAYGDIWSTTDGSTWAPHAIEVGLYSVYDLIEHGGNYYAATGANNGIIKKSANLSTWSLEYDTGDLAALKMIEFGGDLYACSSMGTSLIGYGDYGIFKRDHATEAWSEVYTGAYTQILCLDTCGSYIFAGEHDDTAAENDRVLRSSDGSSWSECLALGDNLPMCFYSDGSRIYVGCGDGYVYYSDDYGENWDSLVSPTNEDIYGIAKFNSLLYITTQNYIYTMTEPA